LQWEHLADAATTSIVNKADILEVANAKSDSRRRRSIRIPPDQLVRALDPPSRSVTIPASAEWIEQA
jgi:hypothetical protein